MAVGLLCSLEIAAKKEDTLVDHSSVTSLSLDFDPHKRTRDSDTV